MQRFAYICIELLLHIIYQLLPLLLPTLLLQKKKREKRLQKNKDMNTAVVAEEEEVYNAVEVIREMEEDMEKAAAKLDFERAAHLRDQIQALKKKAGMETGEQKSASPGKPTRKKKYQLKKFS